MNLSILTLASATIGAWTAAATILAYRHIEDLSPLIALLGAAGIAALLAAAWAKHGQPKQTFGGFAAGWAVALFAEEVSGSLAAALLILLATADEIRDRK